MSVRLECFTIGLLNGCTLNKLIGINQVSPAILNIPFAVNDVQQAGLSLAALSCGVNFTGWFVRISTF